MAWDDDSEISEALEAELAGLAFDFDELRDRMRRLLASVERASVVADRGTIDDIEKEAHLVDDTLRLIVPRVAGPLRLDIHHIEPW